MKEWHKPELKEINVSDLMKEVSVNASSGGSVNVPDSNNKCNGILFGCSYSFFCNNVFLA